MIGNLAIVLRRVVYYLAVAVMLLGRSAPADAAADVDGTRFCVERPGWMPRSLCIAEADYVRDVCRTIAELAQAYKLPEAYFARLIWQESRFDFLAISPAGAQGIAQFMPGTARLRALRNAFDPAEALDRSAEYLRFLADKFGNLGLAAAAYNGGEGRMSRYVNAGGYLPGETRYYVEIITGLPVEAWQQDPLPAPDFRLGKTKPFIESCLQMAESEAAPTLDRAPSEWRPWGVLLAQNFTQSVAVRHFERVQAAHQKLIGAEKLMLLLARNPNFGPRLRHYAMIGRDSRKDAEALCAKLQADGGSCIVRKN